jgi:ABC-type sugar transport system substrate-binding protein
MMAAVLGACGSAAPGTGSSNAAGSPSDPPGKKKVTVALAVNALDVFQTEWRDIFVEVCEEKGAEVIQTNADGKVDKQLSDVEALIERKPDVIVIKAVDSQGSVPAFEACETAGIPTIASDLLVDGYDSTLKLGSDQYVLGLMQNEWYVKKLDADPNFKLKIGYIWGSQGMSTTYDRYQGFLDGLVNAYPGRVELLAEKVCNWSATEAMAVTEDWLQAFPEMNAILSQSDEMALGCVNTLTAANADFDNFYICAYDGSPEARQALRDGKMKATVYTHKRAAVEVTVEQALRIAGGENLAGQFIDYTRDVAVVMDADNLDEMMARFGITD